MGGERHGVALFAQPWCGDFFAHPVLQTANDVRNVRSLRLVSRQKRPVARPIRLCCQALKIANEANEENEEKQNAGSEDRQRDNLRR
jgi:hypothetical protein